MHFSRSAADIYNIAIISPFHFSTAFVLALSLFHAIISMSILLMPNIEHYIGFTYYL